MSQVLINFREEKMVKEQFAAVAKAMGLTASGLIKLKMREVIQQAKTTPGFSFGNDAQFSQEQAKDLSDMPASKKLDQTIYSIFGK